MAFFRAIRIIHAQRLSTLTGYSRSAQPAVHRRITFGEVVEAVCSASTGGRVIIRYQGLCYRIWKEELLTLGECIANAEGGDGVHA